MYYVCTGVGDLELLRANKDAHEDDSLLRSCEMVYRVMVR